MHAIVLNMKVCPSAYPLLAPTTKWNAVILCIALSLLVGVSAHAQVTWDPSSDPDIQGGSGTWDSTSLNWTTDGGASHGFWTTGAGPATFAGNDGAYSITLANNGNTTNVNGLVFNASGYTLTAASAQTLTVVGIGRVTVAAGKSVTVGNNATLHSANSSYGLYGGGTLYVFNGGRVNSTGSGGSFQIIDGSTTIVNGGTVDVAKNLILNNSGTLTIASGSVTAGTTVGTTYGLRYSGDGTVNLDGGTLATSKVYKQSGTSGTSMIFNFNGGTLKASGGTVDPAFMTEITTANVKEGGAKIDTNGNNITVAQGLLHSGAAATDGGLTKSGSGTLTLSGVNTYTGNTTIENGTFSLADNAGMKFVIGASGENNRIIGTGTGSLLLDGDFTFDLSGAASVGSWTIVDDFLMTTGTFGSNFTINGFTETSSGIWESGNYKFMESTGLLQTQAVPEPSLCTMLIMGFASVLILRKIQHTKFQG